MPDLSLKSRLQSFAVPLTSAKALAARYVVEFPVSLKSLLTASDLVMASRTFRFPLDAETVAGWTEVEIRADGKLGFRGHVHESGALSHHFYMFAVIDVRVEPGTPLIVIHGAWVHWTLGIGSPDDDWGVMEFTKHSLRLAELWDAVIASPPSYAVFDVKTTVVELTEALTVVVGASALTVGAEQLANSALVF